MKYLIKTVILLLAMITNSTYGSDVVTLKVEVIVGDNNMSIGDAGSGMIGTNKNSFHQTITIANGEMYGFAKQRDEYNVVPECKTENLKWVNKNIDIVFAHKDGKDLVAIKGYLESTPYYDDCRPVSFKIFENQDRIREQEITNFHKVIEMEVDTTYKFKLDSELIPTVIRITRIK